MDVKRTSKFSGLVIYSYLKDGAFTAVKTGWSVPNLVCERGIICQ